MAINHSIQYQSKLYKDGEVLRASDLNNIIHGLDKTMANEATQVRTLHMGDVEMGCYTATGTNYDAKNRVTMVDTYCVPVEYSCNMTFHSPDENMWLGIAHGVKPDNLSINTYWIKNGESFTFPDTSKFYRCAWGYANDKTITSTGLSNTVDTSDVMNVEILTKWINEGLLSITYQSIDNTDVVNRNFDAETYIKSMMMDRAISIQGKVRDDLYTYPIICHTSDTHGDYERLRNFFKYSKYINADATFITGDICGAVPANGCNFLHNLADEFGNGNTCVVMGNHDSYHSTSAQAYDFLIKPLKDKNNYICNNVSYYYKDMASKSLRIIGLSPYDYPNGMPRTDNCAISQEQINWFIETLKSTPVGYGICILLHVPMTPYANIIKVDETWQYWKNNNKEAPPFWESLPGITGQPIIDIVDAFISRSSISGATFTNSPQANSTTPVINCDFSSVDPSIEFIAYFNGHTHTDVIGYCGNAKNPQVVCNVCCCIGAYGTPSYYWWGNMNDVPRGLTGKSQDAFNIYIIDRANHEIRIGRVGSNMISNGKKREFMTIDYKNKVTG